MYYSIRYRRDRATESWVVRGSHVLSIVAGNIVMSINSGKESMTLEQRLREAGLRPTRQRIALGDLLFSQGDRHVSAEMLHAEALSAGERVSLATVYNTLHQFKQAGLLRELAIEGSKAYFDTNTSNHNHFFVEHEGRLIDIPGSDVRVDGVPQAPEGMKISHIDVVVRLIRS